MIRDINKFKVIHKEDTKYNGVKIYSTSAKCIDVKETFLITFMSDTPLALNLGDKFELDMKEIK